MNHKYSGLPMSSIVNSNPSSEINLFPNPSNGLIKIELPSAKNGLSITILNSLGQEVYSQKINSINTPEEYSFDLSSLQKGAYYFVLKKNDQKFIQKLIIE